MKGEGKVLVTLVGGRLCGAELLYAPADLLPKFYFPETDPSPVPPWPDPEPPRFAELRWIAYERDGELANGTVRYRYTGVATPGELG